MQKDCTWRALNLQCNLVTQVGMNLLILTGSDLTSDSTAELSLSGRRAKHLLSVLKLTVGGELKVGLLNGKIGTGKVSQLTEKSLTVSFELSQAPPPPLPVKLVIALPRPKVVPRLLQTVSGMGVKEIVLMNAFRVEKAFWSCEQLTQTAIHRQLLLGLEQARDTQMPQVYLKKRFKPFVEDELNEFSKNTERFVAHPIASLPCPSVMSSSTTIAVGPEGGFIPYEIEQLEAQGFKRVHLGPRIYKTEIAVANLLSRVQTN